MADRELNILIRARDFFSRTFSDLTKTVTGVKKPADDLAKATDGLTKAEERQKFAAHDALQATQALGDGMQNLGRGIDSAKGSSGGFVEFLKSRFVITLGDVVRGIRTVISGIVDLNRRAVEVQGVSIQFDSLAKSVGETADVMLGRLREATQGAVSDFELMKQQNQAVLLGLNLNSTQMARLAEGAVQLGKATGRTATEALGDLVTGLGRQSKLILDNLGLLVDATAANEAYAASLGKTAESLTDTERKAAFLAAGIKAVEERTAKLASIDANPVEQIGASLTNLKDAMALAVTENKNLNTALSALAETLADPQFQKNARSFLDFIVTLGVEALRVPSRLTDVADKIREINTAIEEGARKRATPQLVLDIQAEIDAIESESRAINAREEERLFFQARANEAAKARREASEKQAEADEKARQAALDADAAIISQIRSANSLADAIKILADAKRIDADLTKTGAQAALSAADALGIQLQNTEALIRASRVQSLQDEITLLEKLNTESGGLLVTSRDLAEARANLAAIERGELLPAFNNAAEAARTHADILKGETIPAIAETAEAARASAAAMTAAGREAGDGYARGIEEGAKRAAAAIATIGTPTLSPSGLQTGRVGTSKGAGISFVPFGLANVSGDPNIPGRAPIQGVQYITLGNRVQALPADLFRGPGFSISLINNLNLPVLR